MSKSHTVFGGSIPENYDRYLGPLLFEFSAKDLASRVSESMGSAGEVLEIACGTGILTKHLRKMLPEAVVITATDISDAMLRFAIKNRGLSGVNYQVADATNLPFDDDSFDSVVCQFGIMFFPDKAKGLSEMVRVMKPGSTLTLNVWDSTEKNPFIAVAQETIAGFFKEDPPVFLKRPFSLYDVDQITALMQDAGLSQIKSDIVSVTAKDVSAEDIARGVVTGNPTIVRINDTPEVEVEDVVKEVTIAIEKAFGAGKPKIELQEIVFTGIKS